MYVCMFGLLKITPPSISFPFLIVHSFHFIAVRITILCRGYVDALSNHNTHSILLFQRELA